jgi:hypothetical protein
MAVCSAAAHAEVLPDGGVVDPWGVVVGVVVEGVVVAGVDVEGVGADDAAVEDVEVSRVK